MTTPPEDSVSIRAFKHMHPNTEDGLLTFDSTVCLEDFSRMDILVNKDSEATQTSCHTTNGPVR